MYKRMHDEGSKTWNHRQELAVPPEEPTAEPNPSLPHLLRHQTDKTSSEIRWCTEMGIRGQRQHKTRCTTFSAKRASSESAGRTSLLWHLREVGAFHQASKSQVAKGVAEDTRAAGTARETSANRPASPRPVSLARQPIESEGMALKQRAIPADRPNAAPLPSPRAEKRSCIVRGSLLSTQIRCLCSSRLECEMKTH